MMEKLSNKIALITGGTTGIGLATALLFRDEGATVIVTGTNPENCARAMERGLCALQSDTADIHAISALMARIKAEHGRIDVLFANAGITGVRQPIATIDEAEYDRVMGINLKGMYFTVQKALPLMPDGGTIILTSSVAVESGLPGSAIYAASKGGVRALARSLAAELLPRGIRVNSLVPGLTDTPIMAKFDRPVHEVMADLAELVPMRRAAQPEETACAVLFLACADSSFTTGSEIRVDGGQLDL